MPSTKILTSMGSSGLAKLSCTPTQHTGMLTGSSSVGGVAMLGGTGGLLERRERERGMRECDRMGAFYCIIHWATHKGL